MVFTLLSDKNEVVKILDNFNVLGRCSQVSKATPGLPTLEVKLTETVQHLVTNEIINKEPVCVYSPSPQSAASGSTELWGHIRVDPGLSSRRILVEGVLGRVDLAELEHTLSYHGDCLTELQPQMWATEGPLKDVTDGGVACFIKLKIELGFVILNHNAFKVSYVGESQ